MLPQTPKTLLTLSHLDGVIIHNLLLFIFIFNGFSHNSWTYEVRLDSLDFNTKKIPFIPHPQVQMKSENIVNG